MRRFAEGGALNNGEFVLPSDAAPTGGKLLSDSDMGITPAPLSDADMGIIPSDRPPQTTGFNAFVRGAGQGATFGFGDEMAGARAASGMKTPMQQFFGIDPQAIYGLARIGYQHSANNLGVDAGNDASEAYNQTVDYERAANKLAGEEHPVANIAGNLAGGLATLPLTGGISGATLPARALQAAKTGAVYGGLSGVGSGEDTSGRVAGGLLGAGIGAATGAAMSRIGRAQGVIPAKPNYPMGVPLSLGQETGDRALLGREQAALSGSLGPEAQKIALDFIDEQTAQLAKAKDSLARGFDQFSMKVAGTPQQAGQVVQDSLRSAAASRKAGVDAAYDAARSMPGEIHAGAFEGIGQKIKGDLSLGDNPVVIDPELTPWASRAIDDVDNRIANLKIENRADPFGQPNPENISGVSLNGVDQMRKRLSRFRMNAKASGNDADANAAQAILDSFDSHVDDAINGGLFNGDPSAVRAWNTARAAHADYRSTFGGGSGGKDPVGKVVQKIIGNKDPVTIPNDVADFIYGSSGLDPNSLNVGVTNRLKSVFGQTSPEWSAVKQGLFSRHVEPALNIDSFSPGKVAKNLNEFLNGDGKEMAEAVYTPSERALLQQYANLNRQIQAIVPTKFASPEVSGVMHNLTSWLGNAVVRKVLAFKTMGLSEAAHALGSGVVSQLGQNASARDISIQMPTIAQAAKRWATAYANTQEKPTPLASSALKMSSQNLARAISPLGGSIGHVLQSVDLEDRSAAADERPY